jgi:hypothetical protein
MSLSEHDQGSLESLSIAELFESCIDKYSRLLLALGDEDCRAVKLKQVSIEKALDEYGRLKVWGEQSRATLPASTRGSLDDALRRDDGLKRNVAQILGHLIHQLGAGTHLHVFVCLCVFNILTDPHSIAVCLQENWGFHRTRHPIK